MTDSKQRPRLSAVVATLMTALAKARPQQDTPEGWKEYEYAMNLARFVLPGSGLTDGQTISMSMFASKADYDAAMAAASSGDTKEKME